MRKKSLYFITRLCIILVIIFGLIFSGYLAIDKFVVPKYFSVYGIYNLKDLTGLMNTMYDEPNEKNFIKNAYTDADVISALNILKSANFPVNASTNKIDYTAIAENGVSVVAPEGVDILQFSDKQLAGILNDMLQSGVLASNLKDINYLDTLSMFAREIVITPYLIDELNISDPNFAHLSFTIKIDTTRVRSQMATYMDVSSFILDMIVPKSLYLTAQFDIKNNLDNTFTYSNCSIAINGRTIEQSKILINLLIDFIFPTDQNMNVEKLTIELGSIIVYGLELIGNFEFSSTVGVFENLNGLVIRL